MLPRPRKLPPETVTDAPLKLATGCDLMVTAADAELTPRTIAARHATITKRTDLVRFMGLPPRECVLAGFLVGRCRPEHGLCTRVGDNRLDGRPEHGSRGMWRHAPPGVRSRGLRQDRQGLVVDTSGPGVHARTTEGTPKRPRRPRPLPPARWDLVLALASFTHDGPHSC